MVPGVTEGSGWPSIRARGSAQVKGGDVVRNAWVRCRVQPVHGPVGRHAELNAAIRDDFGGGVREALAGGAGRHATYAVGGVVLAVVLRLVLGLAGLMVGLMDGSDGGGQARPRDGGSRVGGQACAEDAGLRPQSRSDSPACESANDDGHYSATH